MICIYLTIIYKYPYYDDMYVVTIYIYIQIYIIYIYMCVQIIFSQKKRRNARGLIEVMITTGCSSKMTYALEILLWTLYLWSLETIVTSVTSGQIII